MGNLTDRGEKLVSRIFGVEAALDRVAPLPELSLRPGQGFAGGKAYLPGGQVNAGDQLGNGVLHLQPGIHF